MPKDLKLFNRMKILNKFRESNEITVQEIAEVTGISRQTIVKSVDFFVDRNIVISLGKGESTEVGGKKPELYKFNEKYKYMVCVRFENYSLITALMDLKSNIVQEVCIKHVENEVLSIIINDFKKSYEEIIKKANIRVADIYAIGICLSGICNPDTGIMRYNSLYPSWGQDIPIVDMIHKVVGDDIKVLVANDAKLTGVAELVYDSSLEDKKIVTLYTQGGISSAYIVNGKVELGKNSLIGEIGHMTVDPYDDEVCQCGSSGCFEKMISERRLLMYVKKHSDKLHKSILGKKKIEELELQDYFCGADKGDSLSCSVVEYIAKFFAIALKNIILNMDPELIIIQGKYSKAGEYFKSALKRNMINFKYYPDKANFDIRYDDREIYKLALLGTSRVLVNNLFESEQVYQ